MRIFLLTGFGYGVSIFAAVTITLLLYAYMSPDFWYDLKGIIIIYGFSLLIAGAGGLPGFISAAIIQGLQSIISPFFWMGFGLIAAAVANLLFVLLLMPFTPMVDATIFFYTSIGGLIAGCVYSLFDRRIIFLKEKRRAIPVL